MSYYSDVALGIAFPNKAALITFVSAQRITGDNHMQEAIKQYRVTDNVLWARYEDIKWYPEYDFVRANEQIIANAKLLDYSTLYAEIGEELDDLKWELDEGKKSGWDILNDMFSIQRSITQPDTSEDIASFVKEN